MEHALDFFYNSHILSLWYYFSSFVVIISIIVFIHEYGHYLVAKLCGVKIEAFSIGFGPEAIGWNDKSGTRWKICYLPFGGYVKMFGDVNPASAPDNKTLETIPEDQKNLTFHNKPLWQKSLIVIAGPLANFLLAITILTGFIWHNGNAINEPVAGFIIEGTPAARAGLLPGDRFLELGGTVMKDFSDIQNRVSLNTGTPLLAKINRQGNVLELTIIPEIRVSHDLFGNEIKRAVIGIQSDPARLRFEDVTFSQAFIESLLRTKEITSTNLQALWQIVRGERSIRELGGPIKIAKYSGQAAEMGLSTTIWLIALLSISLGLINLFPIPVLDGGHLLYYVIEAIQGKPLAQKYQEWGMKMGMAFVLGLMVIITANDILQLLGW